MKKRAPFQMRSGNRPSPAKLLGVLSGKTKFKDSKVGKAVNPEGKKFGETKVGKFLKGFGPRKSARIPKEMELKKINQIPTNTPKIELKKAIVPKPKTSYSKAFSNMERVTGKTRMSFFRKNPHSGELYPDSDVGLKTFTDQAKAYNKKKGQ